MASSRLSTSRRADVTPSANLGLPSVARFYSISPIFRPSISVLLFILPSISKAAAASLSIEGLWNPLFGHDLDHSQATSKPPGDSASAATHHFSEYILILALVSISGISAGLTLGKISFN